MDTLIKEEPREGEAIIEESRGAVQIMTIHAAKGKEFPVVILPSLDRSGRPNREPFIDNLLGIGFSPLNPDNDYEKTAPDIVTLIKNRVDEKETAEKKRLLYVGATRAEDRLILSGTLPENGKPQQMLQWLDTHLGICGGEEDLSNLPFKLNVFRQLEDSPATDETLDEITSLEFSEWMPSELESTGISAAFSVPKLANYARCPLRYQLENVLQIPTNGQEDAEDDETETTHHTSKNNFISSELGKTASTASETLTNQHLHADIEGHIIDGRFDSLFKDKAGHWQGIKCETDNTADSETDHPEMELYSLLLHRRYPEQPTVTMNLFFTEQDRYIQKDFSAAELQEAKEKWKKKISELQQGKYNKNLDHCRSCPYADPDGQCIIIES